MKNLAFFKIFLKDFSVASIAPSSRYTVRSLMKKLPPQLHVVVEYGPGDGVVTKEILKHMPPHGRFAGIEMNPLLSRNLEAIGDPRFTLIRGDVKDASGQLAALNFAPADLIISSIPFTLFTPEERERTIRATHDALDQNGVFIVYQYSLLMLPYLKKIFPHVEWTLEPRNLPPMFIMVAKK